MHSLSLEENKQPLASGCLFFSWYNVKSILPSTIQSGLAALIIALTSLSSSLSDLQKTQIAYADSVPLNPISQQVDQMADVYGVDKKLFRRIAQCESHLTQFNPDGTVFRGIVNPKDVGVFQINEKYHLDASLRIGIDIKTLAGNLTYAAILLKHEGTAPWNASKSCWNAL